MYGPYSGGSRTSARLTGVCGRSPRSPGDHRPYVLPDALEAGVARFAPRPRHPASKACAFKGSFRKSSNQNTRRTARTYWVRTLAGAGDASILIAHGPCGRGVGVLGEAHKAGRMVWARPTVDEAKPTSASCLEGSQTHPNAMDCSGIRPSAGGGAGAVLTHGRRFGRGVRRPASEPPSGLGDTAASIACAHPFIVGGSTNTVTPAIVVAP